MPEFKEENDSSTVGDGTPFEVEAGVNAASEEYGNATAGDAANNATNDEERARYALKRGRLPASAVQKKTNQKSVSVDDVCKDAIGTRKNGQWTGQKSTTVVEKNRNRKDGDRGACSCKKHAEDGDQCTRDKCAPKQNQCKCKCGALSKFFKKFLSFFGLCKKCKQCEPKPRQYRHRSHNQRKGNSRNISRSTN